MTITDYRLGRRGFLAGMVGVSALPLLGSLPAFAQDQALRFLGTGDGKRYQPLFQAFEKLSNLRPSFEGVPFPDYQNTVVQRFRTGNSGIDVFQVDPTYVPTFAKLGILTDLTSAFGEKSKGTLFPSDVQGANYNGKMLSLPMWESTQLLFFNKQLLAKAGVEAPGSSPDARMTWDKVIELAKKVQASGAKIGFGFEQVDRYYQLQILPESLGGGPGVKGDDLLTVDVANDAWLQAGKWYGSLYADGVASRAATEDEMADLFKAGRLAFLVGGPWLIPDFGTVQGLEYGVAPHPCFAGGKAVTPSESWHLGVATDSANTDLALQFLDYACLNPEGALASAMGEGNLSANMAAEAEVLKGIAQQNPKLPGIDTLIQYELTNTAIRRPRTLGYLQFEELVTRAWGDIRNGSDAAQTFSQLQRELERSFKRIKA